MQASSKLLVRTAIVLLGLLLAVTMFVVVSNANNQANAMSSTDWATVATSINSYVSGQYDSADGGEKGYLETAAAVRAYLDSNGDGTLLGEGDNAVNIPVLVDVLTTQTTLIPGTGVRVANGTAADLTYGPAVAGKVTGHRNAGFSTEIITYCLTGHAQSPVTMAYGAMSAAGYFGTPSPVVKGLKWGRQGWNYAITGAPVYPQASTGNRPATASLATPAVNTLPAGGTCTGGSGTPELVRCTAQNAIAGAGTGQLPWASTGDATYLPVDIRSTVGADTRSYLGSGTANNGAGYSIATDFGTMFSAAGTYSNLKKLPASGKTIVFVSPTTHTGLMAAEGATMLGYTAKGLRWGMPYWNGLAGASDPNWPEKLNTTSPDYKTYAYNAVAANAGTDTTAPTLSGIAASTTTNSATITWATTLDPTTSMVEYGPGLGSKVNDTVLHASHSMDLSGLSPNTIYDYKVTSYDANANGTSSATLTFTTAALPVNTPPVVTVPADITAEATGPSGAVVTFTATAADAEDGALVPVCTPASGSTFAITTTSVSCTATDSGSLTDTKSFNVTVQDTTAPSISSIVPSGIINTTDADVAVYYSDSASGVNTGSVSVTWDGLALGGCTATASYVSCPQTGLPQGLHTIGVSVADVAGNVATSSGTVRIDSINPDTGALRPRYPITVSATNITGTVKDPDGSGWPIGTASGVNWSTVVVTLDGAPVSGCSLNTTTGALSCAISGLADGQHVIVVTETDNAGNNGSNTRVFNVDTIVPSVTNLSPSGTVGSSTTISADYGDSGTGINSATASVYLDGSATPLTGCTATATGVSCSVSGLLDGAHTYSVSVEDYARGGTAGNTNTSAGNKGSASGSFTTCASAKPHLHINTNYAFWASYADYTARELSVKLTVSNVGTTTGYGVAITGSTNITNGVTLSLSTATPIALGDIAASGSAATVVKYHIPVGVTGFSAIITGSASDTCGTGYTYP